MEILNLVPKDPRMCISYFDVEPVVSKYLRCPECHALYPLTDSKTHDVNQCTCQSAAESPVCGSMLWHSRRISGTVIRCVPLNIYAHQSLKVWLGRLLSRPHIEDVIDNCSQELHAGSVTNIWSSNVFLNLKDLSGQRFYPGPGNEARLIFSISVDSFNPFGNKVAKQSISSTGIWLVVLNLPPNIRYLPKNLYLAGVIPGPSKPSLTDMNDYLQLVTNELACLWSPSIQLSRTFKYAQGRLLKGMVVPVICDLLAAHQIIGHAAAPGAHYMCPLCDLDKDDINIIDCHEWPMKNTDDV